MYRLNTDGSGYTLIYSLDGNPTYPFSGLAVGIDGGFYGEEELGGSFGYGTLDRLDTNGADYTVLYNFNTNPSVGVYPNPKAGLVQGSDGALYGATDDVLFKMSTNGAGYVALHKFGQTGEGVSCDGRLAQGRDGAL